MLFSEEELWCSAAPGGEERWQRRHPACSAPTTLSSILPNPSNSHPPPCPPPFTTSKYCFSHYPRAGAALLWTTLTFRHYLEPLGHQGQHLTYIFTAWGSTVFSFLHIFIHYCCFSAAQCARGNELLISWGFRCHSVLRRGRIGMGVGVGGIEGDILVITVTATDKLTSTAGDPRDPVENILILKREMWAKGQGSVILITKKNTPTFAG